MEYKMIISLGVYCDEVNSIEKKKDVQEIEKGLKDPRNKRTLKRTEDGSSTSVEGCAWDMNSLWGNQEFSVLSPRLTNLHRFLKKEKNLYYFPTNLFRCLFDALYSVNFSFLNL